MNALIEWLDDPQVYRVNQRKAHSDHVIYGAKEEVETGNTRIQSLNGKWQFCYSRNALERPVNFLKRNLITAASIRLMFLGISN